MSTCEPGTVAVATVRGVEGVRVMRTDGIGGGDTIWLSVGNLAGWRTHYADDVTDIRPLVVLDPSDSSQMDDLCKALVVAMHRAGDRASAANGVYPTTVRIALESLTMPPRIPEPGLWGVVEAGVKQHNVRLRWVRLSGGNYRPDDSDEYDRQWDDLIDPTLIRDGVSS